MSFVPPPPGRRPPHPPRYRQCGSGHVRAHALACSQAKYACVRVCVCERERRPLCVRLLARTSPWRRERACYVHAAHAPACCVRTRTIRKRAHAAHAASACARMLRVRVRAHAARVCSHRDGCGAPRVWDEDGLCECADGLLEVALREWRRVVGELVVGPAPEDDERLAVAHDRVHVGLVEADADLTLRRRLRVIRSAHLRRVDRALICSLDVPDREHLRALAVADRHEVARV
eukprot:6201722-Pleurochrysis_carterae.AAC.2